MPHAHAHSHSHSQAQAHPGTSHTRTRTCARTHSHNAPTHTHTHTNCTHSVMTQVLFQHITQHTHTHTQSEVEERLLQFVANPEPSGHGVYSIKLSKEGQKGKSKKSSGTKRSANPTASQVLVEPRLVPQCTTVVLLESVYSRR